MKNVSILFFLILGLSFPNSQNSKEKRFKLFESEGVKSSVLFESENFELKSIDDKHELSVNDLTGLTMDEGYPQLPIYSTLFQINPDNFFWHHTLPMPISLPSQC